MPRPRSAMRKIREVLRLKEIRVDGHPVVIVAGRDTAELLKRQGMASVAAVRSWLAANFAMPTDVAISPNHADP